jgi:tRNA G18 (ribose-2'-O)-methylase SpoU
MKNKNSMVNINEERNKDIEAMKNPKNVREEFKDLSLMDCQTKCKEDRLPFDACFLNITSDLNVSASIRSLHLLGVEKVFVLGKKKLDRRALVGAEFYTYIEYMGGLNLDTLEIDNSVFLDMISRNENYYPIFVEMGGESLNEINWKNLLSKEDGTLYRPLLIFGNEHRGIGNNILNIGKTMKKSIIVSIPMKGVLRSLNVSASVAMVTWDMVNELYY